MDRLNCCSCGLRQLYLTLAIKFGTTMETQNYDLMDLGTMERNGTQIAETIENYQSNDKRVPDKQPPLEDYKSNIE